MCVGLRFTETQRNARMHSHARTPTHTHARTRVHACTLTHARMYTHTRSLARSRTQARSRTHAHTHTRTHTCRRVLRSRRSTRRTHPRCWPDRLGLPALTRTGDCMGCASVCDLLCVGECASEWAICLAAPDDARKHQRIRMHNTRTRARARVCARTYACTHAQIYKSLSDAGAKVILTKEVYTHAMPRCAMPRQAMPCHAAPHRAAPHMEVQRCWETRNHCPHWHER